MTSELIGVKLNVDTGIRPHFERHPLLLTNKQIHNEGLRLFYRTHTFHFNAGQEVYIFRWLESVPLGFRKEIRRIGPDFWVSSIKIKLHHMAGAALLGNFMKQLRSEFPEIQPKIIVRKFDLAEDWTKRYLGEVRW